MITDGIIINNKTYSILKENENYVFLVNTKNGKDILILKKEISERKETLVNLTSDEKFDKALKFFKEN